MHKLPGLNEEQNVLYHNAAVLQARAWKKLHDDHGGNYDPNWIEDMEDWQAARKLIEAAHNVS